MLSVSACGNLMGSGGSDGSKTSPDSGSMDLRLERRDYEPLVVNLESHNEDTEVVVRAETSGGTPPYNYRWYLGGEMLPGASSHEISFTPEQLAASNVVTVVVSDETVLGTASLSL